MKLATRIGVLVCLAVVLMFAGSAFAQEDESASAPDPRLQKALDDLRAAGKPFNGDSSADASQRQANSEAVAPDASTACAYTFTSGSNFTYLQFCVTVNGNIVEFQSPKNVEQIRQGNYNEGYGICDLTGGDLAYWDYADGGASANWGLPVLIMHTANMVKISRTTSDGFWVLTQTITNSPGPNPSAKVLMQLKNASGVSKEAYLFRYADVDPGNAAATDTDFSESFDSTFSSAFGWVAQNETGSSGSNAPSYGLMIQDVGSPVPASVPYSRGGFGVTNVPAACNPTATYASPINLADGGIEYLWVLVLNKQQAVSVTSKYFSF